MRALVAVIALAALSACDLPFGLGLPTTVALESGAADTLSSAGSFEITGSYSESGEPWSIDLQVARPDAEHLVLSSASLKLEAIVLGKDAFFRGQEFLAQHMGSDPVAVVLVQAAGNAWWRGSAGLVPQLPDLTDGSAFRSTFLGPAATQRRDGVSIDGAGAVELSGPRADVFLAARAPYQVLRVRTPKGVLIDGMSDADLRFGNYNHDFGIKAPAGLIDFSNLSNLPPLYTVTSVDGSACATPCVVSAVLKNLGGLRPARAPSTITFAVTATTSGQLLGRCQAQVRPDVGFNATTTVGCTVDLSSQSGNAAIVTATAGNPGPP